MFVDHGQMLPYVVWSLCEIYANESAKDAFFTDLKEGKRDQHIVEVLSLLVADFEEKPLTERISDHFEKFTAWPLAGRENEKYFIRYRYRRLGIDNGFDTLVHLDQNIRTALKHYESMVRNSKRESYA